MFKKTLSQKIARIFEVVNYPLGTIAAVLVMTTVFFPLILVYIFALVLVMPLFCGAGLLLAIKYIKHSRGELDEEKVLGMWVGTIVFNALLLLPNLYVFYRETEFSSNYDYQKHFGIFTLLWVGLIIWWTWAIFLSVTAIWSDERI